MNNLLSFIRFIIISIFALDCSPAFTQRAQFTNITQTSGIRFVHNSGATGKRYLPETLGAGVAFIDYDNDGWQDILFANGQDWPDAPKRASTLRLYHNNHNETFTDVTQRSGLALSMYGMGIAVGDYDNDGYDDVFISAVDVQFDPRGGLGLYVGHGSASFCDVSITPLSVSTAPSPILDKEHTP